MNIDDDSIRASHDLVGKKVLVLATDGFEQSEFDVPVEALRSCGATVSIASSEGGSIKGWKSGDWGESRPVEVVVGEVSAEAYDGLMLPGGVINSDQLRMDPDAVALVRSFFELHKPVGVICHAGQILIEADVVRGRRLTSYPSIRKDLENAGALWEDSSVVVDQGLVTSRKPDDLPDFCDKLCEEIAEGEHKGQHA